MHECERRSVTTRSFALLVATGAASCLSGDAPAQDPVVAWFSKGWHQEFDAEVSYRNRELQSAAQVAVLRRRRLEEIEADLRRQGAKGPELKRQMAGISFVTPLRGWSAPRNIQFGVRGPELLVRVDSPAVKSEFESSRPELEITRRSEDLLSVYHRGVLEIGPGDTPLDLMLVPSFGLPMPHTVGSRPDPKRARRPSFPGWHPALLDVPASEKGRSFHPTPGYVRFGPSKVGKVVVEGVAGTPSLPILRW